MEGRKSTPMEQISADVLEIQGRNSRYAGEPLWILDENLS